VSAATTAETPAAAEAPVAASADTLNVILFSRSLCALLLCTVLCHWQNVAKKTQKFNAKRAQPTIIVVANDDRLSSPSSR